MSDRLVSIREAAGWLGLREATVRAWILRRRITVVRVGTRAIRIPVSAIQKIIEAGTIPAREER